MLFVSICVHHFAELLDRPCAVLYIRERRLTTKAEPNLYTRRMKDTQIKIFILPEINAPEEEEKDVRRR